MKMMTAYELVLRELDAIGVHFACIGTFALHLHGELPDDYVLHDVDIVIEAGAVAIETCHRHLTAQNWQFFLWDQRVDNLPALSTLQEKCYLRACKEGLCLDIIFSGLMISTPDILERSQRASGILIASLADIFYMKTQRNSPADRSLLARIKDGKMNDTGSTSASIGRPSEL
jgi:hypothetical protein